MSINKGGSLDKADQHFALSKHVELQPCLNITYQKTHFILDSVSRLRLEFHIL